MLKFAKNSYTIYLLLIALSFILLLVNMVRSGTTVGIAFALSIGAGLSTCIGGLIVFSKCMVHLASPKPVAISLSLSAGVMIFISLVEIFGKSVNSYQKGFEIMASNICFTIETLLFICSMVGGNMLVHEIKSSGCAVRRSNYIWWYNSRRQT